MLATIYDDFEGRLSEYFDISISIDELFLSGSERISLTRFDQLLSSASQTWSSKWVDKPCPCCDKAYEDMQFPEKHLRGCFTETLTSELSDKLYEQSKRHSACPFAGCPSTFRSFGRRDYILKHLAKYHSFQATSGQGRFCGCSFKSADSSTEDICSFSVRDLSAASGAILACHREQARGLILDASSAMRYCDNCATWMIGPTEIQRHFERHVKPGVSLPPKTCPWCFPVQALDPYQRSKTYAQEGNLGQHTNSHLFRLREVVPCPVCNMHFDDIYGLICHISGAHDRKVYQGGRRQVWSGDLNDLIASDNTCTNYKPDFVKYWSERGTSASRRSSHRSNTDDHTELLQRALVDFSSDQDDDLRLRIPGQKKGQPSNVTMARLPPAVAVLAGRPHFVNQVAQAITKS